MGRGLAKQLQPGSVVAFCGPLGAGKTCLIQGICAGLGAKIPATSPSFVMVNYYPGKSTITHLDLYRIKNLTELIDLGGPELFYGEGICLIEWAEKAGELLPEKRWDVDLKIVSEKEREISISKPGTD